MNPCVSVIIPSFNRASLLKQTIPSYLQPEVGELIFVDDASSDNTESAVRDLCLSEPRIKYIRLEKNSGQPHANNTGVAAAAYPYLYFGDDDSFLTEGTIGKLLHAMQTCSCDIAAAKALYMHSERELAEIESFIVSENRREMTDADVYFDFHTLRTNRGLYYGNIRQIDMCQACFMIKAELAKKISFDEGYRWNAYREETDYLLQAIRQGAVLYGVPEAYQINLPRKLTKGGGAHIHGKLLTMCHTFYNNHYFLEKHHTFLVNSGRTRRSRWKLETGFIMDETFGRIKGKLFRRRRNGGNS